MLFFVLLMLIAADKQLQLYVNDSKDIHNARVV